MPPTQSPQIDAAPGKAALNPSALTVAEVAKLLSAAGGKKITPAQIQADLDDGAPAGPGGTINLVHYTAWLLREVQTGGE
jgi:hypothetical protein